MPFTHQQKTELSKLHHKYELINQLSNKAGMNPDKFINEFNFKFMDITELNRQLMEERNTDRQKAFHSDLFRNHKSGF